MLPSAAQGLSADCTALAMLDHARQRASGERIAAHGYGRAWDAGLGMLGDATAQTATRRRSNARRGRSTAKPGRDDHERNEKGDSMAITDELRDYAHDCCARVDDAIHAIADRIDEQNAEAQRRWMAELDAARDRDGYLREQMERLVTLLRNDCDIDASWDGLRGFWLIGLTENGCLMRDRACKAEAENDKLRELCAGLWDVMWACAEQRCPHRYEDCFVVSGNGGEPKGHGECWYKRRMRELRVVDE